MSGRGKTCEQLSAYLDGELSDAEARRIAQAVEGDPELRRELAELSATRELLRSLPGEHAPEDLASRVLSEAERVQLVGIARGRPARPALRWVRYGATAAVLLVAASVGMIIGVTLWSPPRPEYEVAVGSGRGITEVVDEFGRPAGATAPKSGDAPARPVAKGGRPEALAGTRGGWKDHGKDLSSRFSGRNAGSGAGVGGAGQGKAGDSALVKDVGNLDLALAHAEVSNEIIFTDRMDLTTREVVKLLRANGIVPAVAPEPSAPAKAGPARAERANVYLENQLSARQIQYEAWVTPDQVPAVQKQLDGLRARQAVSQKLAMVPRPGLEAKGDPLGKRLNEKLAELAGHKAKRIAALTSGKPAGPGVDQDETGADRKTPTDLARRRTSSKLLPAPSRKPGASAAKREVAEDLSAQAGAPPAGAAPAGVAAVSARGQTPVLPGLKSAKKLGSDALEETEKAKEKPDADVATAFERRGAVSSESKPEGKGLDVRAPAVPKRRPATVSPAEAAQAVAAVVPPPKPAPKPTPEPAPKKVQVTTSGAARGIARPKLARDDGRASQGVQTDVAGKDAFGRRALRRPEARSSGEEVLDRTAALGDRGGERTAEGPDAAAKSKVVQVDTQRPGGGASLGDKAVDKEAVMELGPVDARGRTGQRIVASGGAAAAPGQAQQAPISQVRAPAATRPTTSPAREGHDLARIADDLYAKMGEAARQDGLVKLQQADLAKYAQLLAQRHKQGAGPTSQQVRQARARLQRLLITVNFRARAGERPEASLSNLRVKAAAEATAKPAEK